MRNASSLLILCLATSMLAACGNKQPQMAQNNDLSPDANIVAGQLPANAEIETLPPDESSETSSGELNAGDDNPDVNDLGNSH